MSLDPEKAKLENKFYGCFCVNPFNKTKHRSTDMRNISNGLLKKFPTLSKRLRICGSCRKKLGKLYELPALNRNKPFVEVIPHDNKSNFKNDVRLVDDDGGAL